MTDAPAPLTPADCDCTDLDSFMLNVERLMASELVALSTHEVIGAAVLLWCRAWKQTPAASLPDDDRIIAAFARMTLPRFRKLKAEVLRGFVKCSDGRLYHRVLAAEANRAFEKKSAYRKKRETDAERLRKWRQGDKGGGGETPDETPRETQSETRFVAEDTVRDGTVRDVSTLPPPSEPEPGAPVGAGPPADEKPISGSEWVERVEALHAELKGLLDPTSPGAHNASTLRKLVETEGIAWPDVRDAVVAIVKTHGTTSKPIRSFAYPPIIETAHANHQRRTNPENRDAGRNLHHVRTPAQGSQSRGLAGAAARSRAARARAGQADGGPDQSADEPERGAQGDHGAAATGVC